MSSKLIKELSDNKQKFLGEKNLKIAVTKTGT